MGGLVTLKFSFVSVRFGDFRGWGSYLVVLFFKVLTVGVGSACVCVCGEGGGNIEYI